MKKSVGAKTIVFPTPAFIVGSYDKEDKPNLMNAAWGGICCSKPPCVAVALREATYSFTNIMERMAFTVNIASEEMAMKADYCGMVSGKDVNKFESAGLTPVKSDLVEAPYIKEFPMALECRVIKTVDIGLHTQFIGEIMDIKCEEEMLNEDGLPDIKKIKPLIFDPAARNYYSVGPFVGEAFKMGGNIK